MVENLIKRTRIGVIVASLLVLGLLAWYWASTHLPFPPPFFTEHNPPPGPIPGDMGVYYTLDAVFSTLNATLLVFLLVLYAEIYVKQKVDFTLWLTIFCGVLLLDALTSNPLLRLGFGFGGFGLGPFAMLPDVFTFVALVILLYLTLRY